jgi:hypothetical protein
VGASVDVPVDDKFHGIVDAFPEAIGEGSPGMAGRLEFP